VITDQQIKTIPSAVTKSDATKKEASWSIKLKSRKDVENNSDFINIKADLRRVE
jgi:hypothetical protein